MALAMQAHFAPLRTQWQALGHDLDLGIGIAQGFATLGAFGFEGRQDYSAIGPGAAGWPLRQSYHLLHLLTLTTTPVNGSIVDVVAQPGADPAKLLTAYVSPTSDLTILGLDKNGAGISPTGARPVAYSVGGLPPNTLFRLICWNADGTGTNREIGFIASDPGGVIEFAVPLHAVFALTTKPLGQLPW